jgi:hypothetical protein
VVECILIYTHFLSYCQAMSVAGGQTLEYAFSYSMGGDTGILTPDMASVDWMVTVNFREGNEMETDFPQEFQYQPRGYAKYAGEYVERYFQLLVTINIH